MLMLDGKSLIESTEAVATAALICGTGSIGSASDSVSLEPPVSAGLGWLIAASRAAPQVAAAARAPTAGWLTLTGPAVSRSSSRGETVTYT
eukprot:5218717-Prymnesium_polylepis.2